MLWPSQTFTVTELMNLRIDETWTSVCLFSPHSSPIHSPPHSLSIAADLLNRQPWARKAERNNEHSLHPEEMQPQIVDKCYADLPPRLSQDTAAEHIVSPWLWAASEPSRPVFFQIQRPPMLLLLLILFGKAALHKLCKDTTAYTEC